MEQVLLEQPMARPKGRPRTDRVYASVKIDVGVLSMVKVVAGVEKKTSSDWVSDTLEPILRKRMGEIAASMSKPPRK